jgi:predicted TPR repeat methyltransferase
VPDADAVARRAAEVIKQARRRQRVAPAFFEDLYVRDDDPWSFETSEYEGEKYAHMVRTLAGRRFDRALEVGCSIGVFTEHLTAVADEVLAIDVSSRAVDRARTRLAGRAGVEFAVAAFPEEPAATEWNLVVCSDVLNYLDIDSLAHATARLRAILERGGTVLAVHWREESTRFPFNGDEVHDHLLDELDAWHALDDRRPEYRLDRFDGVPVTQD